jgi:hypothetical protein
LFVALPGYLLSIIYELGNEALSNLFYTIEYLEPIGEAVIEKLKGERDLEYSDNKGSFVVPLDWITSYQKFGVRWMWLFIFALKKIYFTFDIIDNGGTRISYCVYSNNPKGHLMTFERHFLRIACTII